MQYLHNSGWVNHIREFADKRDRFVVGLCGGFQILGKEITDPHEIEGTLKRIEGLNLLDISTEIEKSKVVRRSVGRDKLFDAHVCGYEIHMGRTDLFQSLPFLELETVSDGAMNSAGNIFGTYLHGLFDSGIFRKRFLEYVAKRKGIFFDISIDRKNYWEEKDKNYDLLAEHFSGYTDVERIMSVI